MKQLRLLSMAILTTALCMVSCNVEDGIDGTNGENGTNGTNGENGIDGAQGENGIDGENGQGFDELTQFGHINLEMQGTRPDDVAFDDTASFKFTAIGYLPNNSVTSFEIQEGVFEYQFHIERFLSTPDDEFQYATAYWELQIVDPGEPSQDLNYASIRINNYAIIGEDNKYFELNGEYSTDDDGVPDFEISDVTYDTTTNNLTFSYSMLVVAENNDSNNDLNISGTVDVIVLEQIVN